ncbi:hypothetical protein M132_1556 [Bacteroides fragilis str. S24L15]|nr:hypothetical protein M132_1556 [Bacteroides fragilis str. S24L15]EYA78623.1 hypothetical protein M134_3925 [Bacteroides fragilis str. S24L34]
MFFRFIHNSYNLITILYTPPQRLKQPLFQHKQSHSHKHKLSCTDVFFPFVINHQGRLPRSPVSEETENEREQCPTQENYAFRLAILNGSKQNLQKGKQYQPPIPTQQIAPRHSVASCFFAYVIQVVEEIEFVLLQLIGIHQLNMIIASFSFFIHVLLLDNLIN